MHHDSFEVAGHSIEVNNSKALTGILITSHLIGVVNGWPLKRGLTVVKVVMVAVPGITK